MTMPAPAADRTCIVTGASSGIGAEIARDLARKGYGLTLTARREDRLTALADELRSDEVRVEVVAADLTIEADRVRVVKEVLGRGLLVDVLVNNAGLSTSGPVHGAEPDRDLSMIRTNVEAVVHLTTLVLPAMVERGAGGILNVASTAAFQPVPGQAGYGATKAFVLSYGHALRAEVRGTGVHVTTLCPGPVQTGFGEAAGISDEEAMKALPKIMWVPADQVAKAAVSALIHDNAVIVPGLANRLMTGVAWMTPRSLLAPILARQHPSLREHRQ